MEPLGAEVLLYFSTAATGVVSSAAAADVGEDAAVAFGGDDEAEQVAHVRTRQPVHEHRDGSAGGARGRHAPALLLRSGDAGSGLSP